jgi:hypothetical protein
MEMSVYLELIACAVVVLGIHKMVDWYRSPRVWIIEDSPSDMMILKQFIDAPDVAFTYINSVADFRKKILSPWNFKKPDFVICDYHLDSNVKGTQIINLCERNGAECLLVTGDDREILGIDSAKIVRKKAGYEYCQVISDWIMTRELKNA